ncbi:capsule assembly Wzi family protein [Granulicella cerasi]|uniref:Capsule assembly Wzi family protein n=1 Tax=Granulicella cerasi TaxID=741063 RepID=A0ABW1Z9D7_9BACT|nr:capsule assembly Wzi family protein [Granulicella cerasi]
MFSSRFSGLRRNRYALLCGTALLAAAPSFAQNSAPATPTDTFPSVPVSNSTQPPTPALPAYQAPEKKPVSPHPEVQTVPTQPLPAYTQAAVPAYAPVVESHHDALGSTYINVDSQIYPMAMRLYSMGYLDTAFIAMRPWTRRALLHMLQQTEPRVVGDQNEEAMGILARLKTYLQDETEGRDRWNAVYGADQFYTRLQGVSGLTLKDSFHLGQTLMNDYGRPYSQGFNNFTGFSSTNEWWRFSLQVRGEYQYAPSWAGYSYAVANQLSGVDLITNPPMPTNYTQDTIPYLNTGRVSAFRLQEAVVSFHVLGHEISGGKSDAWLGPGMGGAMAWSNNAENIYSFRINRVEPLYIPLVKRVLGPLRYDFFVGSLKGHTSPNEPWIHSEMFSFRPTSNFEFGFQRSVIWGGHGHTPITLHTFLNSFFSFDDTGTAQNKYSRDDPGARFSDFSFSWRLPFLTHSVTLYTDSIVHDDVTPPSAPRRAAYRPGIYLSHVPGIPKLDLRVEASSTDTSTLRSIGGQFNYREVVQLQGYTNKGFIMGDWVGREAKAGQAWLTYHLSPDEFVQVEYMHKKTPKDFIAGGTTQNQFKVEGVKRFGRNLELDAWMQYERWVAPVYSVPDVGNPLVSTNIPLYKATPQNNVVVVGQLTWYPKLRHSPPANAKLNGK